ncbi:MAG: SoxR reducing system RseC family protein [Candidatus Omnitrophota bacterium]
MLTEVAEVVEANGNAVKIKFTKRPMCSCCNFNTLCKGGEDSLSITNVPFPVQCGDKIEVSVEEKVSLVGSILLFGIPIVIFVTVVLLLKRHSEITSFLAALCTIAFYYAIIKIAVKKKEKYFNLKILRKL